MKNYLMFALLIGAASTMAFGQTVTCDGCTHDVSVYMGEGGLIAESDADEVVWVTTCDGVTVSGELTPNDDGKVSMLFDDMNGLACHSDKGSLQLGPIMDGGWYWITDDMNSAVGGLVGKDIQDNEAVTVTSAGDGVTMTVGKGAVYLKETATGRVGILPNILPEPPAKAADRCGPRVSDSSYAYTWEQKSSCMLGGGRTKIRLIGPGSYGAKAEIKNGMVYRPTSGIIEITADLWVDEAGSYATGTAVSNYFNGLADNDDNTPSASEVTAYRAALQKGWFGKDRLANGRSGAGTNWLTATFGLSLVGDGTKAGNAAAAGLAVNADDFGTGGNDVTTDDTANNGSGSTPAGQATIVVAANGTYCPSRGTQHTATVNIYAIPGANEVHPSVAIGKAAGLGSSSSVAALAAITQLKVVCAPRSASSAHEGQELVPENLFPTDR